MSTAEHEGSNGEDFKAGANEDAQLGRPDSYSDSALAEDMAIAGDPERSRAAFERGVVKTVNEHDEAMDAIRRDPSYEYVKGQTEEEDVTKMRAEQEARGEQEEAAKANLHGLEQQYGPFPNRRLDSLQNEARDVRFGEEHDTHSTPQANEKAAEKRAEELESWAESLHKHPEAAEGWTAQACVDTEEWISQSEYTTSRLERELAELRTLSETGKLTPADLEAEFKDVFGYQKDPERRTDAQRAFSELLSSDETTIGQVREHLFGALQSNIDAWHRSVATEGAKLAAIRGEVDPKPVS